MIEQIRDSDDRVVSYMERMQTNEKGYGDDNGKYVFIRDVWVHDDYRYARFMERMFSHVYKETPDADWVYWERHKKNGKLECFPKHKLIKRKWL